ncbi:MAG: sigma-70 family RNA polymerase sigma factor [Verrucomicrobiales bacterium]|nr:sigma-70 family RNA polymerase sigma factor [Verrucomicrobiales bacterium]
MTTNPDNFEDFMRSYQDMVFATAMRLLANNAEAEDVAQEVFLRAYDRYAELRLSPTVGGWLKTVTRNLCLNHLQRYRARWRFFSEFGHGDDDRDDRVWDVPVEDKTVGEASAVDRKELLEQALQKLPASQRVPLVLYHYEDLSYEEIAERLHISLSKLKTDIHRGREALRRKLQIGVNREEFADEARTAAAP